MGVGGMMRVNEFPNPLFADTGFKWRVNNGSVTHSNWKNYRQLVLKQVDTSKRGYMMFQTIPVTQGVTYVFSFYGANTQPVNGLLDIKNALGTTWYSQEAATTQQYECRFTTTSNTISLHFATENNGTLTIWKPLLEQASTYDPSLNFFHGNLMPLA